MYICIAWLLIVLLLTPLVATASIWHSQASSADPLATCPGYIASNVKETSSGLIADLWLAGKACDVYGDDLKHLVLSVEYQTGTLFIALHVLQSLQFRQFCWEGWT